jgi:hypothetical protein
MLAQSKLYLNIEVLITRTTKSLRRVHLMTVLHPDSQALFLRSCKNKKMRHATKELPFFPEDQGLVLLDLPNTTKLPNPI